MQTRLALTDRRLSLFLCFRLLLLSIATTSLSCVLSRDITTWRLGGGKTKSLCFYLPTPLGTQQLRWSEWQSSRKFGRLSIIVIIWSSWCFPYFAFPILVENHGALVGRAVAAATSQKVKGAGCFRCLEARCGSETRNNTLTRIWHACAHLDTEEKQKGLDGGHLGLGRS